MKLAVIGLGAMGYGVASSCLRAGHTVFGVDISAERVAEFVKAGGHSDPDFGAMEALTVVVLNAAQVEAVLFGAAGAVASLPKGAVVINCATVPPEFAKEMEARCAEHGVHYLDAPISGGAAKAATGQLSVMASGSAAAFAAAKPVLDACAETVFTLGDHAGPGSAMKAVNQLLAGVHIATMAEALTFGMTQGVAPATFLEVISKCAGTSWMLENRAPHIIEGDYTPRSQVDIWPKDLGIVLETARQAGFDAPMAQTAIAQFARAAELGLGGEDDAAVAKVYARAAGLTLPGEPS